MRCGPVCRFAVVAAAVAGLSATGLAPADGVQTARFGLAATGARSKIVHAATGAPIQDGVVVFNRTASPLTISLDVVGVTQKPDGSYSLGSSGAGLAHQIRLQTRSVTLPAKGRQTVGVTINPPGEVRSAEYAAVTAVAGPASSPGVSVTERLAVLVGLTPAGSSGTSSGSGGSHKREVLVIIATVLLLAILAFFVARLMLRRRR